MDFSADHSIASQLATFSPHAAALPEDVLQRIFSLRIQGPLIFPPPRGEQRLVLSQVCDQWRRILVSTTTFWTAFDFIQCEIQHPINLIQLAELFFCRSGETISLSISFRSFQSNLCRYIFDLVVRPRAHRIWFLSCCATKTELAIFSHIHFPFLRAIDIAVTWNPAESTSSRMSPINLGVFQRTPVLRQASLRILDGVRPNDLCLPWGRLTRVDLGKTAIQVHTFMDIMEQSLRLEDGNFCVDFSRPHSGQPTTLRKISVPSLRELRVCLVEPSRVGDMRMFRDLEMPGLKALWVEREELEHATTAWNMTIYEPLLANLRATLNHLTIAEYSILPSDWYIPRLNRIPQLRYQDIDGALRTSQSLTSLFLLPGVFVTPLVLEGLASGELLPFLEKLGVSSVRGWDIVNMVLRKNLASTLPHSGPLFSSAVTRPVALNYLHLFVIGYAGSDISELDDAARALHLVCGYVIRHAHGIGIVPR